MKSMDIRISELVENEFSNMQFSNKYSNQAKLRSKCQSVVTNEWGFNSQEMFQMIDKYVNKFVPDELD